MSTTGTATKIKYRIISCTGEDPEYPYSELLTPSPNSKGWQSPRFCDYPQEMTLQFTTPSKVKQIQFLSHQSKISSKIELYAFMPNLNAVMPNSDFKWKKLGYLSLDANERSNFQARELKSVFLDSPALYMKIVFHKCHLNRYNLFNQVGLIALSVYGEPLATDPIEKPTKAEIKFDKMEFQTQFDQYTLQRMKQLEEAKERAVKNEDFEEAKRIKEAIERLRHIGAQLQQLEERKIAAIKNEDYDAAKVIKEEIERLRYAVAPQSNKFMEKLSQENTRQSREPTREQTREQKRNALFDKEPQQILEEHDEEVKASNKENIELPISRKNRAFDMGDRHVKKDVNEPFDEQVIPALRNGGKQPPPFEKEEGMSSKEQAYQAEKLSGENAKFAEPLIPYLGEEICEKIFSKNWNAREDGIATLEKEVRRDSGLLKTDDPGALFTAILGAVSYTVADKIIQVSQKAMAVIQALLEKPTPKIYNKQELHSYADATTTGLLEKIGDNNARLRENAEECFMEMCRNKTISCNFCVMQLLKNTSVGKHKTANSVKHMIAKLGLLRQIVREFGINNADVPYTPTVEYAVRNIENSNADVRTAAFNLTLDIYKLVGDKLRGNLTGLRQNQLELLEKEFDAIGGGGDEGHDRNRSPSPEQVVSTHINPHGGKGKATKKEVKQPQPQYQPSKGTGGGKMEEAHGMTCEFCGKVDKNLKDDAKYDVHLYKECPMLTPCPACNQTVQIADLNQHLLEECDQKKTFRKCPQCKEAVHVSEYKQHTEELECLRASPLSVANRCPLCHQDIPPGETGWKKHLINEGCPNNDRTV